MKKTTFFKLLVVAMAVFSLVACKKKSSTAAATDTTTTATTTGSTGTAYSASNTPSKTKVATPSTLNSSSSATAKYAWLIPNKNVSAQPRSYAAADQGLSNAEGLKQSKETVKVMKSALKEAERNMMFIDAAIADGSVILAENDTAGCQDAGVVQFTFTADMLLAMKEDMKGYGMTDAEVEAELADMASIVGTKMSGPAIHYYKTTVLGVAGKGIKVGDFPEEGAAVTSGCTNGVMDKVTEDIKFSDDFSKLIYKSKRAFGTDKMSVLATYDGATNVSTYEEKGTFTFDMGDGSGVQSSSFVTKGKFRQCSAAATDNCVDFKVFMDMSFGGQKFKYDVRGRADNNGGFAKGKQVFAFGTDSGIMWMKEYFDGTGTLTGLSFADGGIVGPSNSQDCFKTDGLCTWNTVIALAGTSAYETGAEPADGGKALVFAYAGAFTASDDGFYILVSSGQTTISQDTMMGMVQIEKGVPIMEDLFIPPTTSGVSFDLYKETAFDKTTGLPTYSTTKKDTTTVTF